MSDTPKNDNIMAEIGEAIDNMEPTPAPEPQVDPGKVTKPEATAGEPKTETPSTSGAFVAGDDLIKRGVLAGLDVADVKAFQSKEQAERIIAALESKAEPKSQETKGTKKAEGAGFPADDFEKAVKEMEDAKDEDGNPDYDPKFISLFKTMNALLKSQSNEIAALKKAGATAEVQSAFDKSFSGLDEGVRAHVDAATKSMLKAKFDFLKSAHMSAKDNATDAEVFDEASKIVLGDLMSNAGAEARAAAAAKRQALALARPGGESGLKGNSRPATEEDVVNELFQALTR